MLLIRLAELVGGIWSVLCVCEWFLCCCSGCWGGTGEEVCSTCKPAVLAIVPLKCTGAEKKVRVEALKKGL